MSTFGPRHPKAKIEILDYRIFGCWEYHKNNWPNKFNFFQKNAILTRENHNVYLLKASTCVGVVDYGQTRCTTEMNYTG